MTAEPQAAVPTRLLATAEGKSAAAFTAKDWTALVAVALTWGASFLFIARSRESFHPLSIGLLRVAIGCSVLSAFPVARGRIDRVDRPRLWLLSITWMAVPMTMFPLAQAHISSAVAGMLNAGVPLMAAPIAAIMLRRPPGRHQIAGLTVGAAGVVAISLPSIDDGKASVGGLLMILLAVASYGLSSNISVPLTQKYGAATVQRRIQLQATVVLLPLGMYGFTQKFDPRPGPVLSLVTLAAFGTGAAFMVASWLMGRVGATRGSVIGYCIPVVAILLGWGVNGDSIVALHLVGIALVLTGAFLTSRSGR